MLISNNITELILLKEERFFKKRFTHKDEASQAECALKISQKTSNWPFLQITFAVFDLIRDLILI